MVRKLIKKVYSSFPYNKLAVLALISMYGNLGQNQNVSENFYVVVFYVSYSC